MEACLKFSGIMSEVPNKSLLYGTFQDDEEENSSVQNETSKHNIPPFILPRSSRCGDCDFSKNFLIFGLILYMLGSTFLLQYLNNWSFGYSLYLNFLLWSTIGYSVEEINIATKWMLLFHVIISVCILGFALMLLVNAFINRRISSSYQTAKMTQTGGIVIHETGQARGQRFLIFSWLCCFIGFGILIAYIEKWSVLDGIYFSIITGSTVGFGDIEPHTLTGRYCTMIAIPVLIGLTGYTFSTIFDQFSDHLMDNESTQNLNNFQQYLMKQDFKTKLKMLDFTNSGDISEAEFVLQYLFAMYDIDQEDIDYIRHQFSKTDADHDGVISRGDLKIK